MKDKRQQKKRDMSDSEEEELMKQLEQQEKDVQMYSKQNAKIDYETQ